MGNPKMKLNRPPMNSGKNIADYSINHHKVASKVATHEQANIEQQYSLLASATFLLALLFMLSGCNTIEGIGEDMEEAGERIEDAATK